MNRAAATKTSGHQGNGRAWSSRDADRPTTRLTQTSDGPYVSRLARRASLLADLQALLAAVREPVARAEYRRQVIEENVLSRQTSAARDKAWKELASRYGTLGGHS